MVYVFQLPFKVDIIKHPCEVDGKSTAVHAAILAPHDVTVYHFPHIPDYTNARKVIFIFLHFIFCIRINYVVFDVIGLQLNWHTIAT